MTEEGTSGPKRKAKSARLRKTYTGEASFAAPWAHLRRNKEPVKSGPVKIMEIDESKPIDVESLRHQGPKLSERFATAICGNDITSSCLYVSVGVIAYAGRYAPLVLLMVAGVLYLFRSVYAEVGDALPLNGGAYNCLLNTTSKFRASMAACLTILSYMATAVISAYVAMRYLTYLWEDLPVEVATVLLLAAFAGLVVYGIGESAKLALVIFCIHIGTLTLLAIVGTYHIISDPSVLLDNWSREPPDGIATAFFFGFAAALLGTSGFESSANFIEEQEPGVFPKTLRNMWIAVSVFNPLMCIILLGTVKMQFFLNTKLLDWLEPRPLVGVGEMVGGETFGWFLGHLVAIDAVLVLSGAVLTSYVGVTGLVRRMALDRTLPQVLLRVNRWRGTNHWIVLAFFLLCTSVLFVCMPDPEHTLKGLYLISFLSVMALFALGNILLKVKRGRLPRTIRASWPGVLLALVAVVVGLVGNIMRDADYFVVFAFYFVPTATVVAVMFLRNRILHLVLYLSRAVLDKATEFNNKVSNWARTRYEEITSQPIVFFTRGDDAANLNRAMLYVRENEHTQQIRVIHVFQDRDKVPESLARDLKFLDEVYPAIHIEFIAIKGTFGPELIERLSRKLGVPKNYMFIGCPGGTFPHNIAQLGGVRLIV
jgi:amino acid transporter